MILRGLSSTDTNLVIHNQSQRGAQHHAWRRAVTDRNDITERHRSEFVESLVDYSRKQQAQQWEGSFNDYLRDIVTKDPARAARSSHQYIWDMICWRGLEAPKQSGARDRRSTRLNSSH